MARDLRIEYPSALYHVISRGIEKRSIYRTERDKFKFLEFLEASIKKHRIKVYAYCLMENHYHILMRTEEANLSQAMRFINGGYATYFNVKHERVGHLFANRYKSILVEDDTYLLELSRYIHLNPIRARIVGKPEEYGWSSYRTYLGEPRDWLSVDWLLKIFSNDRENAQNSYRRFVEQGIEHDSKDPLKESVAGIIRGGENFVDRVRDKVKANQWDSREIPAIRKLKIYPDFEKIEESIEIISDNAKFQRKVGVYLSYKYSGKKLSEIGAHFGGIKTAGVSLLVKRFKVELKRSFPLFEKVRQVENKLSTICKI